MNAQREPIARGVPHQIGVEQRVARLIEQRVAQLELLGAAAIGGGAAGIDIAVTLTLCM